MLDTDSYCQVFYGDGKRLGKKVSNSPTCHHLCPNFSPVEKKQQHFCGKKATSGCQTTPSKQQSFATANENHLRLTCVVHAQQFSFKKITRGGEGQRPTGPCCEALTKTFYFFLYPLNFPLQRLTRCAGSDREVTEGRIPPSKALNVSLDASASAHRLHGSWRSRPPDGTIPYVAFLSPNLLLHSPHGTKDDGRGVVAVCCHGFGMPLLLLVCRSNPSAKQDLVRSPCRVRLGDG